MNVFPNRLKRQVCYRYFSPRRNTFMFTNSIFQVSLCLSSVPKIAVQTGVYSYIILETRSGGTVSVYLKKEPIVSGLVNTKESLVSGCSNVSAHNLACSW